MLSSLQRLASTVLVQPQTRMNNYQYNRNREYYLQDVVFQVEGQLFKVNRHLFIRLSPVFRDIFEGSGSDGFSDEQPLVLDDVKRKDFVQLLRCLYPLQFQGSDYEFSLEEWQSVLRLASLYEMTEVKTFAIRRMAPLLIESPCLQIHLAKTYDIGEWLLPGLLGLVRRDKVLDEEDVKLVGLSDALKICALRERKRRCERCGSCDAGVHSGGFEVEDIRRVFGISDLPSSVPQFEEICTCPPRPPPHHSTSQFSIQSGFVTAAIPDVVEVRSEESPWPTRALVGVGGGPKGLNSKRK
ncbi:hypothetical protein APHAL10511_005122 [Amanita phalloides]|nr:hypothetical protein APHAL10511_005122 [Amanita phalloides]